MAQSSMAINTDNITTFANDTINTATDVNSTVNEIVTKFNRMLETTTGHFHDGTDAKIVYGGVAGFTAEDIVLGTVMGIFDSGGI